MEKGPGQGGDHYPFGMVQPGRNHTVTEAAFGFNGMRKDDEIAGSSNNYTAPYWQYDPRLGRRWNPDPVEYPWQSDYATFNNNPVFFNDPLGLEGGGPGGGFAKFKKKVNLFLKRIKWRVEAMFSKDKKYTPHGIAIDPLPGGSSAKGTNFSRGISRGFHKARGFLKTTFTSAKHRHSMIRLRKWQDAGWRTVHRGSYSGRGRDYFNLWRQGHNMNYTRWSEGRLLGDRGKIGNFSYMSVKGFRGGNWRNTFFSTGASGLFNFTQDRGITGFGGSAQLFPFSNLVGIGAKADQGLGMTGLLSSFPLLNTWQAALAIGGSPLLFNRTNPAFNRTGSFEVQGMSTMQNETVQYQVDLKLEKLEFFKPRDRSKLWKLLFLGHTGE